MNKDQFWVEDFCILFEGMKIFPTRNMSTNQKLNALTRLSLVISVIMYLSDYKYWYLFLILAILLLVLLKYGGESIKKKFNGKKEGFTVTPTYMSNDFHQTTVTPLFAEEWHIPPPAYDLYTQVEQPFDESNPNYFQTPIKPQSYPYGQYLTRTNLLPADEYVTHQFKGSPRQAREYINSQFLRHDMAFKENMTRILKKKLNRRFRQSGCNDTYSPFHSY